MLYKTNEIEMKLKYYLLVKAVNVVFVHSPDFFIVFGEETALSLFLAPEEIRFSLSSEEG